jgi:hypothetical protein
MNDIGRANLQHRASVVVNKLKQFFATNPDSNMAATVYLTRDLGFDCEMMDTDADDKWTLVAQLAPSPSWAIESFDKNHPNGMHEYANTLEEALDDALAERTWFYTERVKAYGLSALPRDAEDDLIETAKAAVE